MNTNRTGLGVIINRVIRNRYFLGLLAGVILLIIVFLVSKNFLLQKAVESAKARLKARHYTIQVKDPRLKGFNTLYFRSISIRSDSGTDEMLIDSLSLKIRIFPALFKKIRPKQLLCRSIYIQYQFKDNAGKGLQKTTFTKATYIDQLNKLNFSALANKYIRRYMVYLPATVHLDSIKVKFLYKKGITEAALINLDIFKGKITAQGVMYPEGKKMIIPVNGKVNKSKAVIELEIVGGKKGLIPVPLIQDKFGITTGFDTLFFRLDFSDRKRHLVNVKGIIHFSNFELAGESLSSNTIFIRHLRSDFLIHLGENYMELDSASTFTLNKINLKPYLRISQSKALLVDFRILPETWMADDFFASLPDGMFSSLIGLKAAGRLKYSLRFKVDFNQPDSLIFDTKLIPDGFKILKFGADNYTAINGSFYHQVFYKGQLIAGFIVGPENPDFTPLDQISPYLRSAVMTSEDGSFYYHHGFNPDAFRESIATDIREGRFARGGSTISMQLVKNVFLTRSKTLARKIEEALIVWLIENYHLVPKQRMYEIYLNIIEWGPGVYGINQASHFYFNKRPADLDLQESIFLASIVPHPRWYKYTFESNGVPKPFFDNYFAQMKSLMVRKKFIDPDDTIGISPLVYISGPASQAFVITDTTAVDSTLYEDLNHIPADEGH